MGDTPFTGTPLGAAKCFFLSFSAVLFLQKQNRSFRRVPGVLLLSGAVWEGTAPGMPDSQRASGPHSAVPVTCRGPRLSKCVCSSHTCSQFCKPSHTWELSWPFV